MIIHLVRHAEAIERSPDIPEEHRFLTSRGRMRFRKIAARLRKLGVEPDLILTSPLVRAVQTADILAEGLRFQGGLLVEPLLAPGFSAQRLDEILQGYPQVGEIALVGHEPDLGLLAQALLAEDDPCSLKKGAVLTLRSGDSVRDEVKFLQLVDGGGKVVTSRGKALERLQADSTNK